MKYYVIWSDGQKFGPADVDTLNQWIQEGRVTPETELESVATMARLSASSVPGLVFSQAAPVASDLQVPTDQPTMTMGADPAPSTFASPYGVQESPSQTQPANSPYQYPPDPTGNPYPRNDGNQTGQTEAIVSIILSVVGLCCCCLVSVGGLVLGYISKNKGNQLGKTAVIVGWVCVGLSVAGSLVYLFAMGGMQAFR